MERVRKLASGSRVGPYIIARPLGAGGMGEVYRARDERIGRDVAIKVLPEEFAADRDRLKRLQQEAHAAGILNHPNLLTVHELGVHEESPFIVTELLEGRTLREGLNQGALPVRKVIDYGVQIANGLAAAHEKGIVHRDLKPENLFVTEDDRIKILDFGLAKLTVADAVAESDGPTLQRETDSGVILGTVGYMSPEQVRGDRVDARSDLFSLGAILYETLTGQRAFKGDSRVETLNAILKEEPLEIAPTDTHVLALQRVIRHCLEKQPRDRFQSARDVAFDLEGCYGTSAAAPTRRATRASRALLVGCVVTALAVPAAFLSGRRTARISPPGVQRLTFRSQAIADARFSPDGQTIVYSASSPSDFPAIFAVRPDSTESRALGYLDARLLGVSISGEVALKLAPRHAFGLTRSGFITTGTLARVPLSGSAPREILESVDWADWDPLGKILAVARNVQGKHRIEFPPGQVWYETVGWVSNIRVSPDGKTIAFFDHPTLGDDGGSVATVTSDRTVKRLASDFVTAQGLAWRPDGGEIWFTAGRTGIRHLYGVDLDGRERTIYVAPQDLTVHDIAPDGRILLTMWTGRRRVTLWRSGDSSERDLTWLDYTFAVDVSPDGKLVLLSEMGQGGGRNYSVYVRPTDGSPATRLGDGAARNFSPDGRFAFASLNQAPSQHVLYPLRAGEPRHITTDRINLLGSSWFPDEKRFVFAGTQAEGGLSARRLYVQQIGQNEPKVIAREGVILAGNANAVSPDGQSILVTVGGRIGLLSAAGGEPRLLPDSLSRARPMRWNVKGDGFYFRRPHEPGPRFYEFSLRTGQERTLPFPLASQPLEVAAAVITPDGQTIVVTHNVVEGELYLMKGLK